MKIPEFVQKLGLLSTTIYDVSEIQTNLIQKNSQKKTNK